MEARVTAQDLYIRDLEHCVRELQRIVDRFRWSAAATAGLLPDGLCDVLVPEATSVPLPARVTETQHYSGHTSAHTGGILYHMLVS